MVKEPAILHTTIARLLEPGLGQSINTDEFTRQVSELSRQLCGTRATFSEVWYVEELDLLALALRGRYVQHNAPLRCSAGRAGGKQR